MSLTLAERQESRKAIASLRNLQERLEDYLRRSERPPVQVFAMLVRMTGTSDLGEQYEAVSALLEEMQQTYNEKLRVMAPTSFSAFCEYLNPDEPPAAHHEFLIGKLEAVARGDIMRLMVSMPPGHAKSTYSSHRFPPWYLGRNPNKKYIQAGHSQDFVEKEFGLRTRGIIDSAEFRSVFPGIKLSTDSKAAGMWAFSGKHTGRYLTRGVGQGISGFRANIAAVDDPYAKREDAESATIRNSVFTWFTADFMTRLLPKSPLFIVATRWHSDDLCGRLEEMSKEGRGVPWEIINLPAFADSPNDPMGRAIGMPLWPDFYSYEELQKIKAVISSKDWNSLYQGTPIDQSSGAFSIDWMQRYAKVPANITNDRGEILQLLVKRVTVSVDTASKTQERNDFTVITVWIEDIAGKHYLVDVIRGRWEFNEMSEKIDGAAHKWKANAILVEDKGSGTQYIQTHRIHRPCPIIPIQVGVSNKEFRFDGVLPTIEAGDVFFPKNAPWLAEYEKELKQFPNGTFDDQVDSTSQYLAWATRNTRRGTKKLHGAGAGQRMQGTELPGSSLGAGRGRLRGSRAINAARNASRHKVESSARIAG